MADINIAAGEPETVQMPEEKLATIRCLKDAVLHCAKVFDMFETEDRINTLHGWMIQTDGTWHMASIWAIMPRLSEVTHQIADETRKHDALVFCVNAWGYPDAFLDGLTVPQAMALARLIPPSEHPDRVAVSAVAGLHRNGSVLSLHKRRVSTEASLAEDLQGEQANALRYLIGLP